MGVDVWTAKFLASEAARGVDFERTCPASWPAGPLHDTNRIRSVVYGGSTGASGGLCRQFSHQLKRTET